MQIIVKKILFFFRLEGCPLIYIVRIVDHHNSNDLKNTRDSLRKFI
jgi:hypothetical protein